MQIELDQGGIVQLCDALAHNVALLKAGRQPDTIGQLSVFLLQGKQKDRQPFRLTAESLVSAEAFCRDLTALLIGRFGEESGVRVVGSDIATEFHDIGQRAVVDDLISVPGWITIWMNLPEGRREEWPVVAKLSLDKHHITNICRSLRTFH